MNVLRRSLLKAVGSSGTIAALLVAGLLKPTRVLAADWQRQAFTAHGIKDSLKAWGAENSAETRDIVINAAEISENGAQVPIEIVSHVAGSQSLAVFVEKNPMPLAASFSFSNGAIAQVRLQLKMAESSRIRVLAKAADGKTYHASREIKVTLGGCG
ncbi:MAG: thiosulfate oxidation carrier protein SoxY [Rhodocyclaceae bacterium]